MQPRYKLRVYIIGIMLGSPYPLKGAEEFRSVDRIVTPQVSVFGKTQFDFTEINVMYVLHHFSFANKEFRASRKEHNFFCFLLVNDLNTYKV